MTMSGRYTIRFNLRFASLIRLMTALITTAVLLSASFACDNHTGSDSLDEARLLRQSGRYVQSVMLFEELVAQGDSQPGLLLEFAETAVLAAQAERSSLYRQKAREAVLILSEHPGDIDPREIGELWRRLAWEMARNADSLQAFQCFEHALNYNIQEIFEEEWLFRGVYAGDHLEMLSDIPDSVIGLPASDSLLSIAAEIYLVELERISRSRTDLREDILKARAALLPYTSRIREELDVLTELDRLGGIQPEERQRRIHLLLDSAEDDIQSGRSILAREKLLEVWNSNFSGERIQAAYMLGLMAEENNSVESALQWYRRACSVSPGSSSLAASLAAARRDSLTYGIE